MNVLGEELKQGANKITNMLDRARTIMHQESKEPIAVGEKYLKEYGPYQWVESWPSCLLE